MATDAEGADGAAGEGAGAASGDGVEQSAAGAAGERGGEAPSTASETGAAAASEPFPPAREEEQAEAPPTHFVEIWNDYDPSMRFVAIFPLGETDAAASSVGYYIIEPGKHTGLHSDNVEEIVFVAEGEGEVYMMGETRRLEPGKFVVFPGGLDHDVYAQGTVALRMLSFFPTTEIVSTFQQTIFPMGGNILSSKPPSREAPVLTELDPNNLPEGFPFTLEELGMAGQREPGEQETPGEQEKPRELTRTERLLGFTEDGKPPKEVKVRVIDPKNPDVNLAEEPQPGAVGSEGGDAGPERPAGE